MTNLDSIHYTASRDKASVRMEGGRGRKSGSRGKELSIIGVVTSTFRVVLAFLGFLLGLFVRRVFLSGTASLVVVVSGVG